MKHPFIYTLALATALSVSATAPLAAQEAGTITLGGFIHETRFDEQTGLTSDFATGISGLLGVFVVPNVALELTYGRSWTEDATPAGVDGTYNPLRGRLVWNIPASNSFYPMLGVGAVRNDYQGAGIDDSDVGISGLAGFKVYLTHGLALRADVSLDYVPSPFNKGQAFGTSTVDNYRNWTVSAGLTYDIFRGRSRASAAPVPAPAPPAQAAPPAPAPAPAAPAAPAPPPAPAAPPAPALVLDGVRFGLDRADLSAEARATLDRVAESLVGNANVRIRVVGHTDNSGEPAYNVTLSERRARAVAEYLTSRGVAANRLETVGRGETEPTASNDTRAGREANRRVELARIN